MGPAAPLLPVVLVVAGRGLGLGLFAQTVQLVAYNTVPEGQMGRATSLVNVCQRVDGALSTAVLTAVLVVSLSLSGAPTGTSIADGTAPLPNMTEAFRNAFQVMTALSLLGVLLATFLHDRVLAEQRDKIRRTTREQSAAASRLR